MRYRLYDAHVAALLDQGVHHLEHLRLGSTDPEPEQALSRSHQVLSPAE